MSRVMRRAGLLGAVLGMLGLSLAVLPASPASAAGEVVHKWLTTSDLSQHLTQQANIGFSAASGSGTLSVDSTQSFQSVVGFGAAMTDTSAWLISDKLSAAAHTSVMNALFSPSQGIGISWLRVPMGSSDFSATAQPYSYDDNLGVSTGPTLGAASGRCLDDTGSPANGVQVDIRDCTGGSANQIFAYTGASQLQVAGKCLDANGKGTTNGTKVILPLMQDSGASTYLAGTAWHWYAGGLNTLSSMHAAFPNKDTYETECSDGIDPQNAIETFIQSTRNWARSATMWNVAEDQNNGPVIPGGCNACTPLVTINQGTGNVTYDAGYYSVGHFSKFVLPGAKRIASSTTANLDDVAFRNPDGTLILIVDNTAGSTQSFSISWNGQQVTDSLPSHGIATYEWTP